MEIGSPISIMAVHGRILSDTEIPTVKHRYHDVNKKQMNFRTKVPTNIESEKKQKMQVLLPEQIDITLVLLMNWLKKFNLNPHNHSIGLRHPIRKDTNS